jgi:hypothetical protein
MKIYSDMSNEQYHSNEGYISSSFIKSVSKHSIAKALKPIEPSQALFFGDAMHTYFESREQFHKRFIVFKDSEIIADILEKRPDITSPTMTKEYKSFKNDFECSLQEGQSVISEQDMETIQQMYNSAVRNEGLRDVYESYGPCQMQDEYSFFTEEEDLFGLKYRVRPDRLLVNNYNDPLAIIDWKSCRDASYGAFRNDFWKYRYDLQAAFYCDVLDISIDNFYFVAIEKEYPYNTAVYSVSEDTAINASSELNQIKERIGNWRKNPTQSEIGLPNSNKVTLL